MSEVEEIQETEFRIPLAIRIGLIAIHVAIAALAFANGFGTKQLAAFGQYIVVNIGLLPLVFVVIGLVGKLLDRSFRLENAYYLGLLIALVLTVQKM